MGNRQIEIMKNIYYQPILTNEEWETGNLPSFGVYRNLENAKEDYPDKVIAVYSGDDIEAPTYMDDEDERTTDYYVDIPQLKNGEPSCEWRTIESFKTKNEAITYAMINFGADKEGNISIISES